ncbi:hypothetical protein BYT27DRAFT_7251465 [Phlegmacium glaucopus]|nr:hypothetical protein BYT27DRAFT_7251465 [Phlegmacium glaucopus]
MSYVDEVLGQLLKHAHRLADVTSVFMASSNVNLGSTAEIQRFMQARIMTDYGHGDSLGSTNNPVEVHLSTRSRVYSTSTKFTRSATTFINSTIQHLRPVHKPHAQQRGAAVLHAVEPSEPLDREKVKERKDIIANMPDNAHFTHQHAGLRKFHNLGTSIPSYILSIIQKRTVMRYPRNTQINTRMKRNFHQPMEMLCVAYERLTGDYCPKEVGRVL